MFRFRANRVHSSLAADAVRSPRFAYATEFPQFSRDVPTERFGSSFLPRRIMPSKILPSQKSSRRRLNTGSVSNSRQEVISNSAKSRCLIPLVICGISDAYTHAWSSSSIIVASWGNPIRINIPRIARASSFRHWLTALISYSAADVDRLPWVLLVKLTTLWCLRYPICALVECELSKFPARSASYWNRAWVRLRIVLASYGPGWAWNFNRSSLLYSQYFTKQRRNSTVLAFCSRLAIAAVPCFDTLYATSVTLWCHSRSDSVGLLSIWLCSFICFMTPGNYFFNKLWYSYLFDLYLSFIPNMIWYDIICYSLIWSDMIWYDMV